MLHAYTANNRVVLKYLARALQRLPEGCFETSMIACKG